MTHDSLSSSYWLSKINESYYSRPYNDLNNIEVRYANIRTLEDVEQYISKPYQNTVHKIVKYLIFLNLAQCFKTNFISDNVSNWSNLIYN